jgi:single-strand DNA-binding protein
MAGFNKVILMGNLTRDPELRYTPSGTAVADLGIAVNTPRGRGPDRKDDTLFVDVTVWDRQAENCSEYLAKGRPVMVEGRLKMDTWEDRETGKRRSRLTVVAQTVQFLGGGDGGGSRGGGGSRQYGEPRSQGAAPRGGGGQNAEPQQDYGAQPNYNDNLDDNFESNDDVPF